MKKEFYKHLIVCEYWFNVDKSDTLRWNDQRKRALISGMIKAWNMFNPTDQLEGLKVSRLIKKWTKEDAQNWFDENVRISKDIEDLPPEKAKFFLMDFDE